MPIYFYWGDDDFAIAQAVRSLRQQVLDPAWESFNFDKITAEQADAVTYALNQAMTPPFGAGKRLIWLTDTTICQRCAEDQLSELEQTLPTIPETSVLLLTSRSKPDNRLKSTKLLQKFAEVRDFQQISIWKTDLLTKNVRQVAQEQGVKLTSGAIELLAEAVGNDTRRLYNELEKLQLYRGDAMRSLTEDDVAILVTVSTQSSMKLGTAIRLGQVDVALELVAELLRQNEPALRIVASLVNQFRTWLWVKLMLQAGERDDTAIAQAAELGNPKRLYFLKQEVQPLALPALLHALPILLELDASLKRGADDLVTLQTKVIELCELCRTR